MKRIVLIAANDLRLFLKEKSSYFWLFGSPLLFAFFMGFANRGPGSPSSPRPTLQIEDRDGDFLARVLRAEIGSGGIELVTNSADRQLIIPGGFTSNVLAKRPMKLELTKVQGSSEDAASMLNLHLTRALVSLNGHLLEVAGQPISEELLASLSKKPDPVALKSSFASRKPLPNGFNQSVPGILVMFTMMNLLIFGGTTLAGERREGVLRRLIVQPLVARELIVGKIGGAMLLGVVQIAFILGASTLFMHVSFSGNLAPVLLLLFVYAWVAASFGVFIGSIISREDKIVALCVLSTMVMAAMGGCWWPLEVVPEKIRLAGHLFPTAWAMDGLHQLLSFGGSLSDVLGPIFVLIGFALAGTLAAIRWFRA